MPHKVLGRTQVNSQALSHLDQQEKACLVVKESRCPRPVHQKFLPLPHTAVILSLCTGDAETVCVEGRHWQPFRDLPQEQYGFKLKKYCSAAPMGTTPSLTTVHTYTHSGTFPGLCPENAPKQFSMTPLE